MSFTELLGNVGLFGAAVMICLAAISVFSVGLIVDKHRRFRAASRLLASLLPFFDARDHAGDFRN